MTRFRRPADVGAAIVRARAVVAALDDALAATDVAVPWLTPVRSPLPAALRDDLTAAAEVVRQDMAALEAEHAAAERLMADWAERARRAAAARRPDLAGQAEARVHEQADAAARFASELAKIGEELVSLEAALAGGRAALPVSGA